MPSMEAVRFDSMVKIAEMASRTIARGIAPYWIVLYRESKFLSGT